jgi:uncharacterized membrane protein YfcA
MRPWLLWVGLVYVALFTANVAFARRHDERALLNDLVFIVECSAMVAITWAVGATGASLSPADALPVPEHVWILTAVCALVLTGSTLHVKSRIRERNDPRFARASKAFALVSIPTSVAFAAAWGPPGGLWLVVPFLVLADRALRPATTDQRPGTIGLIELAGFIITALTAALAVS